jgi:predicted RNA-binding protein with EMAP domain
MKSGMQMMLESMLGPEGVKAIEQVKTIVPAVPQLIENIKAEHRALREQQDRIELLLNRVATQNNLILGALDNVAHKVDPNKVEEMPPTLAAHLSNLKFVTCSHCENEVPDLVGCIKCGYGVVEHPTD